MFAEAIASAERGDDDRAESLIAEAEAFLSSVGETPILALVAIARGRKELVAGRYTEAFRQLSRPSDPKDDAYHPWTSGWVLADLADAAVHGDGDLRLVETTIANWRQIANTVAASHLDVQLDFAEAILAGDSTAEDLFQRAIASAAAGWPFYAARAELAYGAWLRRQRRAAESRVPLRQAAQRFDALGQVKRADEARRELRASGETPRRRSPELWTQLSPQELQIAQLAASGLSNREIGERLYLSHRTVSTYLYRLFPKLGITSRTELGAVLPTVDES
jgi:DNA-binding NarL/FixJ family response regulator